MLKPRDGYSFGDFQYEGEKIIDQRKRVPIPSRRLGSEKVEEINNALDSRYCKYSIYKIDISQVIYVAEHPCGSFYHEGYISFGTNVNVGGGGLLSNVFMHQTTISTNQGSEVKIPYCIFDSEIGSSMLFLESESVIIRSNIGCSTVLNGANSIQFTSLALTTLKGENYLYGSDIENFLLSDSRIDDVTLRGFSQPLIIANANIRHERDIFPICKYNTETNKKEGGLLYRTKSGAVAFSTPEYGVRTLKHEYAFEGVEYYVKELEPNSKKRDELVDRAQDFAKRVFSESQ